MKTKKTVTAFLLAVSILSYNSITTFAAPTEEIPAVNTVTTNEIPNWPTGPELNAEAAFLMEANTGVVLYAKNIHEHLYPASTTKMMTALIAAENCKMDEMVSFSHDAVFSLESGSSNIGIDPGQAMSMEECLYGIMVASANEVANAVGEHVAGDMESFVQMMNNKAKELGLQDTHFTNTNGLFDENHYTSAYDLAIIAEEFFNNEYLAKIGNTASYHFVATSTQPDDFYVRNKHQLISGDIPYAGIKGGKTGYTSEAGETLVTCAEQNGMTLICVILKEESPDQFYDTVKLFDYGFSNFNMVNVADNEEKYSIQNNNFFPTTIDILGSSKQLMELDSKDNIIMPKNINFSDMETELVYDTGSDDEIAYINYSYHGAYLGFGRLRPVENKKELSAFDVEDSLSEPLEETPEEIPLPRFINVVSILTYIIAAGAILILISYIYSFFVNYNLPSILRRKKTPRPKRRREKDKLKF